MEGTVEAPAQSGSESSYVSELTGTADSGSVGGLLSSDSRQTGTVGDQSADVAGTATTTETPEVDALFEELAKEAGFEDLESLTPAQRASLNKLVRTQKFTDRLNSNIEKGKAALAKPVVAQPEEELTEFEKELAAPQSEKAAPPAVTTEPVKAADGKAADATKPQGFGDGFDKWTHPKEAYQELNEAWQAGDMDKVHGVETAMFVRRFDSIARPFIENQIQQRIEAGVREALAKAGVNDVIPQVREDLQRRDTESNQSFAQSQVAKIPGNEGFLALFEQTEPGKMVTFRGEQFPDTPYNRIMLANPELLNIRVQHADPKTAERLTFTAIYKAAARLDRQQKAAAKAIQPDNAKRLVAAGAKLQERTTTQNDKTRQTMNAGVGATGAGNPGIGNKAPNKSYVSELTRPAGELDVSDLFG